MYIFHKEIGGDHVVLTNDAFMHLKALRIKVGSSLVLFNGEGGVCEAVVASISRREAKCEVRQRKRAEPLRGPRLVLGIPKISTLEFILQKAIEIGVREILLVESEFTPLRFSQKYFDSKKARWEKIMQSACEQSECLIVPKIGYMHMNEYMGLESKGARFVLHPGANKSFPQKQISGDIDLLVGPEGGWSPQEAESLKEDLVRLPTGILRADTACIAGLLLYAMINQL